MLTVVNLDRFNAAFGIGAAGFSEGMVCVSPDRPTATPAETLSTRMEVSHVAPVETRLNELRSST